MDCQESQVRDKIKVVPEVARAFIDRAKEIRAQGKGFDDIVTQLNRETGKQPETILKILQSPLGKEKSAAVQARFDAARVEAGRTRRMQLAAQRSLDALNNGGTGAANYAWNFLRKRALAAHSVVSYGTHLPNLAYAGGERAAIFRQAFKDVYRYIGEKGTARYEADWQKMRLDPEYEPWLKAGLPIGEDVRPSDVALADSFKKAQKYSPPYSTKAFGLVLKKARLAEAKIQFSELPEEMKVGKMAQASREAIAQAASNFTGDVANPVGEGRSAVNVAAKSVSSAAGNQLLASKLYFAKRMAALLTPIRWLGLGGRMTPVQRAAANSAMRLWTKIAGVNAGILATNYAINQAAGFRTPNIGINKMMGEDKRNILDDLSAWDLGRFRFGNAVIPGSPLFEVLRMPIRMIATGIKTHSVGEAAKVPAMDVVGALNPMYHFMSEQLTGKDFTGRPVPSLHQAFGTIKKSNQQSVSAAEYGAEKISPIGVSAITNELVKSLVNDGWNGKEAKTLLQSLSAGATASLAGTHINYDERALSPVTGKPIKEKPTPENAKFRWLPEVK